MIFIRFFERGGRCWGFQIDGDEEMKCIAGAKAPTKMKRRAAAARSSCNKTHCICLNCKMYFYKFVEIAKCFYASYDQNEALAAARESRNKTYWQVKHCTSGFSSVFFIFVNNWIKA